MNEPINDGGPAFPGEAGESGYGNIKRVTTPAGDTEWITLNQGMTLRDYFAAKAMAGIISAYRRPDDICMCKELLVEAAYNCADAMLVERSKP